MSSLFEPRDAFAEHRLCRSVLKAESGSLLAPPLMTIAIPTFKRIETLREAVASAHAQTTDQPYEILIVDNDPESVKWRDAFSPLAPRPNQRLRFYVNDANLGMFGNWNRCIELAGGEWVTILNDDDLLRPQFLDRCLDLIGRRPETDGIVSGKVVRDRRIDPPAPPARRRPDFADRLIWRLAETVRDAKFRHGFRRLSVKRLFFGNDIGNGAGFLFRRQVAIDLGGYDPDDWPVSDFYFYLRLARSGTLYWVQERLAEVGIGDNESLAKETLMGFIIKVQQAREAMAGRDVPADWLKLSPQLVANHLDAARMNWSGDIDAEAVEAGVGFALPPPSETRELWARLRRRAL